MFIRYNKKCRLDITFRWAATAAASVSVICRKEQLQFPMILFDVDAENAPVYCGGRLSATAISKVRGEDSAFGVNRAVFPESSTQ